MKLDLHLQEHYLDVYKHIEDNYLFIYKKKIFEKNLNYKFLDIIIIIQIIFIFLTLSTNLSGLIDRLNIMFSFTHIIIYSLTFEIIKKYYFLNFLLLFMLNI